MENESDFRSFYVVNRMPHPPIVPLETTDRSRSMGNENGMPGSISKVEKADFVHVVDKAKQDDVTTPVTSTSSLSVLLPSEPPYDVGFERLDGSQSSSRNNIEEGKLTAPASKKARGSTIQFAPSSIRSWPTPSRARRRGATARARSTSQ